MGKINSLWSYLVRHKYLITIFIGVLMVGVVDDNSFRSIVMLNVQRNDIERQLKEYEEQYERDSIRLRALRVNKKGVERVARERYFMKRPNEDVFVLSTDKRESNTVANNSGKQE